MLGARIFSLCEFGHSCVLVVCSVPNLVQISVTVTEIDAFIFSSFNFWSRGHLCMALLRLPMKFGADIFIQSGVIDIFPKLKMAAAAILKLLG